MVGWSLVAFLFGAGYSWVVVRYMGAVNRKDAKRAAAWDGVIGVLAIAPLQAWAASGSSAWVLLAEVVGSMAGTFIATR